MKFTRDYIQNLLQDIKDLENALLEMETAPDSVLFKKLRLLRQFISTFIK